MKTIVIRTPENRDYALSEVQSLPADGSMMVKIKKVTHIRSTAQNALAWIWYKERGVETGNTPGYEHAFCKLHYGVPIMRQDEEFRGAYDSVIKPLGYEEKLRFIEITQFPVTRLMDTARMAEYLDTIDRESAQQGIRLSHPEDLFYEAMGK